MKCEASRELVVGGFTDPQGARSGVGALLSDISKRTSLFAGKVGTGFDTKVLLELRARLDAIEISKSPFTKAIGLPRVRAYWVQPEVVVRVAFIKWTPHGETASHYTLSSNRTPKVSDYASLSPARRS